VIEEAFDWDEPTGVSMARLELARGVGEGLVKAAVGEACERYDSECDALLRELAD